MSREVAGLIDALKVQLAQRLPELAAVEYHGGRFGLDDIRTYATRTPALLLTVGNIPAMPRHSKAVDGVVDVVAFILTRDGQNLTRYEAALNVAEYLCDAVPLQCWGLAYAFPAEQVQARNLHTAAVGKIGVTLWGVTWKQQLRFQRQQAAPVMSRYLYIDGHSPVAVGNPDGNL